ncbi:hypothetical protein LENED_008837 [Lentinula edodes]|uniref:Secreted protein n=1 Tax=Lentinula edodes TaxID=5353 RepID=A0A1Q3EI61_LENED|nr:hypothetical protein LENED_008837 [Lentinula edodes]
MIFICVLKGLRLLFSSGFEVLRILLCAPDLRIASFKACWTRITKWIFYDKVEMIRLSTTLPHFSPP